MASSLPTYVRFLAQGYSKDRASAVSRTAMEDGFVKQLQTKSRVFLTRQFVLEFLTLADYQSFITFYQTTLQYGSLFFNYTDPEDNVVKLGRFVTKLDKEEPIFGTSKWRLNCSVETWTG